MQIENQNAKVINNYSDNIIIENQKAEEEKTIKIKYEGAKDIKEEIKLEIKKAELEENQKAFLEKQLLLNEIVKLEGIIFESLIQSNGEIKGKTTSDMNSIYKNWQLQIEGKLTLNQIEGIYAWKVHNFTKDLYEYNLKNKVNSAKTKLDELKELGRKGINYMKGKFGKAIKTTACLGILLSCFPSGLSDMKAYADSITSNPVDVNMSLEQMENANLRKTIESKIQEIHKQYNLDAYKNCGLFVEGKILGDFKLRCSNGAFLYKDFDGYEYKTWTNGFGNGIFGKHAIRSDLSDIKDKIDRLPESAMKSTLIFYYEDEYNKLNKTMSEIDEYINSTIGAKFNEQERVIKEQERLEVERQNEELWRKINPFLNIYYKFWIGLFLIAVGTSKFVLGKQFGYRYLYRGGHNHGEKLGFYDYIPR